ncbi:MAG: helicase C-terminal domain-containing protein [Chloroflexota bacterium]|nr:helicase C-terminal domain-containing protein [Chloroflexota bacterium]
MSKIVAVDIETTGLNPKEDSITEIGAVKFDGRRVEDEWSTLVNPRRSIPNFISQLTGISNNMVRNAPFLPDVIGDLIAFVGDAPVVGHNISFDLTFLRQAGALRANIDIDTYELAAVLMPTATRYNLSALAQQLGILLPATHRALDDARATHAVFIALVKKAHELPLDLLAELVRMGEPLDWQANWPLKQVLRQRIKETVKAKKAVGGAHGPLFEKPLDDENQRVGAEAGEGSLDIDDIAAVLDRGGKFADYFDEYEYRPQQVDMLRSVGRALSESLHLMVEAGTGTGKSLAYLIPAAHWALQNNTRVVISTNTINLQDQLINKDIPDLRKALKLPIRAAVLKGRSNYLCPRRLAAMRRRKPENVHEMRVLGKVLVWLLESQTGDRAEINLNGNVERMVWSHLSAEDEGCRLEVCLKRTGGRCPFYRAKIAAENAHLLVVNHALLLADMTTNNRVLPPFDYLIVDEAHHLESATTSAMAFQVRAKDIIRLNRELGGPKTGVLGRFVDLCEDLLKPAQMAALTQLAQKASDLAFRFDSQMQQYFKAMEAFLVDKREGRPLGTYPQQERILPSTRTLPIWIDSEIAWEHADETLTSLMTILRELRTPMRELADQENEEAEDMWGTLGNMSNRLVEIQHNVNGLTNDPDINTIYWIEINPKYMDVNLNAAPLHIGSLMEKHLWYQKESVILTSATLTTNGECEYLKQRLNGEDADELVVGSPFDYETAALVYLATDIPEPSNFNGHQKSVEYAIVNVAKASGGRMLALFTSYAQLRRTSKKVSPILSQYDIQVFEQGEGASRSMLLDTFRNTERAVLLGTRSFWEGVDIPGDALSVLLIVKLPFDVPSDPIISARSETFEDPFYQYALPEAILRFRQGFGRLIRTQTDRGVVAVLDKRVLTKKYGRLFVESLPNCEFKQGLLADLPKITQRWLNI